MLGGDGGCGINAESGEQVEERADVLEKVLIVLKTPREELIRIMWRRFTDP